MRTAAALVAIVAMTCPALARRGQPVLPPELYDHPYTQPMMVTRVDSVEEVRTLCKTPLSWGYGCAYRFPGWCHIIIAGDDILEKAGVTREIVMRHENAHCNGWPKDHFGARVLAR
jgi:hypothetical protein